MCSFIIKVLLRILLRDNSKFKNPDFYLSELGENPVSEIGEPVINKARGAYDYNNAAVLPVNDIEIAEKIADVWEKSYKGLNCL